MKPAITASVRPLLLDPSAKSHILLPYQPGLYLVCSPELRRHRKKHLPNADPYKPSLISSVN